MKLFTTKTLSLVLCLLTLLSFSHSASYDVSLALELAYMSAAAYEPQASINSWTCGPCKKYPLTSVQTFYASSYNILGFTGFSTQRNAIFVVFRGSQDIKNWIVNIETGQSSYPGCDGCKVHSGFYTAFKTIQASMNSQLKQLKQKHSSAKIYVSGHSLGGALALLAAPDIRNNLGHADQTYAYGCPRVGNSNFAKFIEGMNGFRVIHYADIVVHLPPANFGFTHVFNQVWYDQSMSTHQICAPETGCANSISATNFSVDDHDLNKYYIHLKSQVAKVQFVKDLIAKIKINLLKKFNTEMEMTVQDKLQEQNKVQYVLHELQQQVSTKSSKQQ